MTQVTPIRDLKGHSEFEQVQKRLIEAGTNPRDKAFISTLGKTGIRISEAIQLKETDIDFNRGTLTIVHLKERLKLKCPTGNDPQPHIITCRPSRSQEAQRAQDRSNTEEQQRLKPLIFRITTRYRLRNYAYDKYDIYGEYEVYGMYEDNIKIIYEILSNEIVKNL